MSITSTRRRMAVRYRLPTPKCGERVAVSASFRAKMRRFRIRRMSRCLRKDIRYSTFDIGSRVISCLREYYIFPLLGYKPKKRKKIPTQKKTTKTTFDFEKT